MQSLFQWCVYCFDTTMASYKVTAASERSPSIEAPRAPQMGATVRAAARWRTEQLVRSFDCAAALSGTLANPTVAHLAQVVCCTHYTLPLSISVTPSPLHHHMMSNPIHLRGVAYVNQNAHSRPSQY